VYTKPAVHLHVRPSETTMTTLTGVSDVANKCFNCGQQCNDDDYCHGCGAYVCGECWTDGDAPWGKHAPEDHLDDGDDNDM
jgi:recombinational DNA repair protein (RecF pathway)